MMSKFVDNDQIKLELYELLQKKDMMTELVNLSSRYLGNPVFLMDADWNVVAVSGNAPENDLVHRIKSREGTSFMEYARCVTEAIDSVRLQPYILDSPFAGQRRMIVRAYCDGFYEGHLTILEKDRPLTEMDKPLAMMIAQVYALALRIQKAKAFPLPDHAWTKLLQDLLTQKLSRRTEYELRLQVSTTLYLPSRMKICRIDSRSGNITADMYYKIAGRLESRKDYVAAARYDGSIALLVDTTKEDGPLSSENDILELAYKNAVYFGISAEFSDLFYVHRYFQGASRAVLFAKRWGMQNPVQNYDDCKLYDLMTDVHPPTGNLKQYVADAILSMIEYDKQNSTQFYHTIKTYFDCNQNVSQTADRLYIHKTTLAYRLKRMQILFHIDWKDASQLLFLQVSIYIMEIQLT
ncbi:PucR-like helix-turn-helix protein [Clostridium sp. KNHs216]|nr:PucR-like helix-turn-helix protein [Clostridium sp. KNHs216]